MYPQLDNGVQFRLGKIDKRKDFFIAENREPEAMSKRLFDYFNKFYQVAMFLLLCLLITITSASFGSVFSINNGIVKTLFKAMTKMKRDAVNFSVLNSTENMISKSLIDNGITTIINEVENCHRLKESIGMMKSQ